MIVDKQTFDQLITERYNKWVYSCTRLVTHDEDEAHEIVNDFIEYTYKRLTEKGIIEVKNVNGYVYSGCKLSYISPSSPFQRKRQMQYQWLPLIGVDYDNEEYEVDYDDITLDIYRDSVNTYNKEIKYEYNGTKEENNE